MKLIQKRILPLIVLVLSTLIGSVCWADNQRFNEANASYSRNEFNNAIEIYEALISEEGYSAGLLYNLANSYAQIGETGKAVLNYRRALVLNPSDADIRGNLELVLNSSGIFASEKPLVDRAAHLLTIDQWILLGSAALLLLIVVMIGTVLRKLQRSAIVTLSGCSLLILAFSLFGTTQLRHDLLVAVVTGSDAHLIVSPFEGAATAGEIKPGRVVTTEKTHGEYLHVTDETGRKGWIQMSAVEHVLPAQGL